MADAPSTVLWRTDGALVGVVGPDEQPMWNPATDTDHAFAAKKQHLDFDARELLEHYPALLAKPGSRERLARALRRVVRLEAEYRSAVAYLPAGAWMVAHTRLGWRLYERPVQDGLPWLHLLDLEQDGTGALTAAWFGMRRALIQNIPIQDRAPVLQASMRLHALGAARITWFKEQRTDRVTHEPYGQPIWRPRHFEIVEETADA